MQHTPPTRQLLTSMPPPVSSEAEKLPAAEEDCRSVLNILGYLLAGDRLCSNDGTHTFGLSNDGDLGIWHGPIQVWSAGTCWKQNVSARLQSDGNFVVRHDGGVLWSSQTQGSNAQVYVHNDGSVTIGNKDHGKMLTINPSVQEDVAWAALPSILAASGDVLWAVKEGCPTIAPSPVPFSYPSLPPSSSPTTEPSPAPSLGPWPSPSLLPSSSPTTEPSPAPSPVPSPSPSLLPSSSPTEKPTTCVPSTPGRTRLQLGDFVCSPNGQYKFGMSFDGELVFLDGSQAVWKAAKSGSRTTLQDDGNLVLRDADGPPLWASNTADSKTAGNSSLVVGDDGVAAIRCSYRGYVWSTAVELNGRVVPESLYQKVMAGYQGWFHAKGDGGWDQWVHWSLPRTTPNSDNIKVDMWPDVSELDDDELFPTNFSFANGSVARVYSSYKRKTVERHCRWMQDYNIDGFFHQRFIGVAVKQQNIVDKVLSNVRSGSEKFGRVFAVLYDISGGDNDTLVEDVINDWKHLVDDQLVTKSRQYLHHRGRPLLSIWGLGFLDRVADYSHAVALLDWFQNVAEEKYKVTMMGGVPAGWRDLTRDSRTDSEWTNVYRRFDVISPWTVGRYHEETADSFLDKYIIPDIQECEKVNIDYLPVVFPGFSAFHHKVKPFNQIPRLGGRFLWHQIYNALTTGNSSMIYIAMFDEVDEGTAIYKVAATQEDAPVEATFLTLDADGDNLPNDWYLRLAGEAATILQDGTDCPAIIPISP